MTSRAGLREAALRALADVAPEADVASLPGGRLERSATSERIASPSGSELVTVAVKTSVVLGLAGARLRLVIMGALSATVADAAAGAPTWLPKVGVTCALKNLVGINANKNWLPHHTEGAPDQGGDQFPESTTKARLEHAWMGAAKRWLKNRHTASRLFVPFKKIGRLVFGDTQQVVRSGNWHGNDTCWRMVLDLNKCFFFFDGGGDPRKQPMRYLTVVDGIIAGEGNGPMSPDPKACGVIIAGTHPVAVDCVAATLMGFDWQKLRLLKNSFQIRELNFVPFRPEEIEVISNKSAWTGKINQIEETFDFRPHFGWVGAIENNRRALTA